MENINLPCKISCYDEEAKFGLKKAKVIIMHEGTNRNNTHFSLKSIKKAEETIKNRPLLGYIERDDDGEAKDFTDHRRVFKITKDGVSVYYLEQPLGVFPESCNPRYEDIGGVTHFVADCYIWENYSNEALSLIEDTNGEKQVSMEICLNESEELDNGVTDITDFTFMAVTILGDDVIQGMNGTCGLELFSNNEEGTNLEEFTKDITTKIKEIERGESKMDKDIFGLGANELARLVVESLDKHTYTETYWGEEMEFHKYGFVDLDTEESVVITRDYQNRTIVGIPYSLDGESISLDLENASKYVSIWKKTEGETQVLNFENTQLKEKYDEKIELLQEAYSNEVKAREEVETKYEANLAEYENLKTEVAELREYKEEKEKAEKQMALEKEVADVVSEFELKFEELEELTSKVYSEEITVEEFKKELLVMEGMKAIEEKKKAKFSKDKKEDDRDIAIQFNLDDKIDAEANKLERQRQAYGGIFKNQI